MKMTNEQHIAILASIASMANHLTDLARRTFDNASDVESVDALTGSIESIAKHIGFMADCACDSLPGGVSLAGGDPYFWMMPPNFHEARADSTHQAAS